jgi:hypothetical protein
MSANGGAAWSVIDPTDTGAAYDWTGVAISEDGSALLAGQYEGRAVHDRPAAKPRRNVNPCGGGDLPV